MKKFDWTIFFPGQVTFLLLPHELIAVRGVSVAGQSRLAQTRHWPCPDHATLAAALESARNDFGVGSDMLCHVGLPLQDLTLVEFTLPLAAKNDLDNAVRYALMRHVPFELDALRWDYTTLEEHGEISVAATLMPRLALNEIMAHFSAAKIPVATVFPACLALTTHLPNGGVAALARAGALDVLIWSGRRICWQQSTGQDPDAALRQAAGLLESYGIEGRQMVVLGPVGQDLDARVVDLDSLDLGAPRRFRINVISERDVRGRRRARRAVLWAAVVLLLTLMALPFRDVVLWQRRVAVLEDRVAALRQQADSLLDVREKSAAFEKRMERWAKNFATNVDMGRILREMTEIMPAGSWLDSLQVQERKILLAGAAPSATFVLEQVEISPLFQDARFDAPVTRQGELEVFRIAATISPQ